MIATSVIAPVPLNAQAKTGTPLGSIVIPAHEPIPSSADLLQAVKEIGAIGGHASLFWQWSDGSAQLQYIRAMIPLVRQFGLKVFVQLAPTHIGTPDTPNGLPETFTDPNVQTQYLHDVGSLAALHPEYLNLGAEINLLFYITPAEFTAFETLYQKAYTLVKLISPQTQVGVSYHMDLYFGDLEFNVADGLGPQDFIGFTTYPAWTVYRGTYPAPDQMDTAYYDRIRIVIPTKPIVFSEVGWPSGGLGSLSDQEKYVAALPKYMAKVHPVLVTWTVQHDANFFQVSSLTQQQLNILNGLHVDVVELFNELNTMGMLSVDDNPKPSWVTASGLVFSAQPAP